MTGVAEEAEEPVTLLGPSDVRGLADELGLRPTKARGQNFVVDPNTIRRIVAAAEIEPADVVLEVGPGLGSLTLGLLPAATHVHTVELDPLLAQALPDTVARYAPELRHQFTGHLADALALTAPPDPAPTALVANLPYNAAVPVVLHSLATMPTLRHGLVLVQHEVAERLTAVPGTRAYGGPTAKLAWFASARLVGRVPRRVFWPMPRVDSSLVAFTRRPPPPPSATGGRTPPRPAVFAVVEAAFGQRRKTLRVSLAGWAGGTERAERILTAAGVPADARAESLTIAQFAAIAVAAGTVTPS